MSSLWHEESGRGSPVLLLHAGIADSRMWEPQFRSFRARHRVVRFDARGFGRSPFSPGRFSPVDDVRELLDALGIERAALVGASYGGAIAVDVAIAYPEWVSTLVLVGASLRGRRWGEAVRRFQEAEERALEAGDIEEAVELNLRTWVDAGRPQDPVRGELRRLVAEMQRRAFDLDAEGAALEPAAEPVAPLWRAEARLHEIGVPTLVVVGEHDVEDVRATADVLVERIPLARKAVVADAAHLPSLERPAEFDRLVLEFLADAEQSGNNRR